MPWKSLHLQRGYAGAFSIFECHTVSLMSSAMLKKNIPRQQVLEVIWRFAFEDLHGFIARESGIVNSGDEGTQC